MSAYDVLIRNHGTLVSFQLITPEALEWARECVNVPEFHNWFGDFMFVAEPRYADPILTGMLEAGFTIRANGKQLTLGGTQK